MCIVLCNSSVSVNDAYNTILATRLSFCVQEYLAAELRISAKGACLAGYKIQHSRPTKTIPQLVQTPLEWWGCNLKPEDVVPFEVAVLAHSRKSRK